MYLIKTKPKSNFKLQYVSESNLDYEIKNFNNFKKKWEKSPDYDNQIFEDFYFKRTGVNFSTVNDIISYCNSHFNDNFFKKEKKINLSADDVLNIKQLQADDLYYLYSNLLFKVLYVIPQKNENDQYYYNLIIAINKDINLNKIINYSYNLITIDKIIPISILNINNNFIENLFPTYNSIFRNLDFDLNDSYLESTQEIFFKNKILNINPDLNSNLNLDYQAWNNIYKSFDQNLYAKASFKKLCFHTYTFDMFFLKNIDNDSVKYKKVSEYGLDFIFITNYYDILNNRNSLFGENNLDKIDLNNVCWNQMSSNYNVLNMVEYSFSPDYLLKGCIDFLH